MKTNKVLDRATILDCSEPAKLKVIDLIDVLAKFPELFSAAPFEPECKKPFDLDPNDSLLAAPVYSRRQSESHAHVPNFFNKPKIVIPKAPFSNSALIGDPAFRGWFYIDEGDVLQGPFTSLEMDNWFDQGYLFNELLVKYNEENVFHRLVDLFGKPEYPPPRKIERRVSTQDEALPVLEFFKSVSTVDNFPNPFKGRLHKSLNRISLDEHNNPEIKQIMNNLAKKAENSAPATENQAESKPIEKAEEAKPAETKPVEKPVEKETKAEQAKEEKVEETKEAQKSPEDDQSKKKNGTRKHHRKNGKKSHSQVEEQVVQYQLKVEQPEAKTKTPEKKSNKKKTVEKEESVAQKNEVAVTEEQKPVKKSKKGQKAEDEKEKPAEKVPRRHSHAYDRRDKVKYYTVFEPKVDSTELKDKAQEPVMIGDQSK